MSILGSVVSGRPVYGQRIVIAGHEKVGKTTLACDAPNSLLIPLEQGFGSITTPRLPDMLTSWEQVEALCLELIQNAQAGRIRPGSSIVWDSATALERLIHDRVLRLDAKYKPGNPAGVTMESALEGYGKAYSYANDLFGRWMRYQDELAIKHQINCITTCHVFASLMMDPASGEYHSWDLQLHSPKNMKTYGKREFITQWADMIGFYHEPMFVSKAAKGETLNRAIAGNVGRQLAVERTPAWIAGNRYGITGLIPIPDPNAGPPPMPPGWLWNHVADAIYKRCGIDLYNRG